MGQLVKPQLEITAYGQFWQSIVWLIWISFSDCPRRCCFSLAHAAQRTQAWQGFHAISFLCREALRTNCQAFASASVAAQACVCWEKTPWSKTPVKPGMLLSHLKNTNTHGGNWYRMTNSAQVYCSTGNFFLEFSLSLRKHHFSQQERPAQRNMAMSSKGERSISFSQ